MISTYCILAFQVLVILIVSYLLWRIIAIRKIRKKVKSLLLYGYVQVESVPIQLKSKIWRTILLPRLLQHWENVIPNFSIDDEETWPMPEDGKSYNSSLNSENESYLQFMPKLFSNNFEMQAIIAYLFDENLHLISYGSKSHWKFLLLTNPLLLLLPSTLYSVIFRQPMIQVYGDDSGWHLLNWPNPKYGHAGEMVPRKTHVDGGNRWIYTLRGVPTSDAPSNTADIVVASSHRLLAMLMQQLGIIFYCDTPGQLGAAEGVTSFFPSSHISILHAILQYDRMGNILPIPGSDFKQAIINYGEETPSSSREQQAIPDGQALLVFGLMAHTLMWAVTPMTSTDEADSSSGSTTRVRYPRSIQNAKIHGPIEPSKVYPLLQPSSLMKRLADSPLELYASLLSEERAQGKCHSVLSVQSNAECILKSFLELRKPLFTDSTTKDIY